MKKTIRPLKKSNNLRILSLETQVNLAVELSKRRESNPDLSINQMLNDLINDGLAVSHHPVPRPSELAMEAAMKSPEWKRKDVTK